MKYLVIAIINLMCVMSFSQVGINTTTPNSILDVESSNIATPTNQDGLLIPRISAFPVTNPTVNQNGMLVYLLNNVVIGSTTFFTGFHYWDNPTTTWKPIDGQWSTGANASGDLLIYAKQADANGTRIAILDDGKFGIGTDDPIERFEFKGPGDNDFQITSANTNPPNVILYNSRGTLASPLILNNGDEIGAYVFKTTTGGSALNEVGGIHLYIEGTPTAVSLPTKLVFRTTRVGNTSDSDALTIYNNGNVGIDIGTPTAKLHLPAGTNTASSAPLKFSLGTNLTVPEQGAVEYDGSNLYITPNTSVREVVMKGINITSNINFPSVAARTSNEVVVTVTGAIAGSSCNCSPVGAIENNLSWNCYVSAANTVRVRVVNSTNNAINPVARNWKIVVLNVY